MKSVLKLTGTCLSSATGVAGQWLAAMSLASLVLTAAPPLAGGRPRNAAPEPSPLVLEAFAWDCDDGLEVVSHYPPAAETMGLFLPGSTLRLPRQPAASGARHGDGTVEFWSKGAEASLRHADGDLIHCRENRRRSLVEDAKLRGLDFRGFGHEPAWLLEIGPDELVVFTGMERLRHVFPNRGHATSQTRRTSTWHSDSSHGRLKIVLSGEACADTMSDETLETTVRLQLNSRVLHGCGQALH